MPGPYIIINNVVQGLSYQSYVPSTVGYNLAHFLSGSNALDWFNYSQANAARVFISPSNIEPDDDIFPWGDYVTTLDGFTARKDALRAAGDSISTYVNWNYFLSSYNAEDTSGNNNISLSYALSSLQKNNVKVLANINASRSKFPISTWGEKWELWQHFYAQAYILSRDYGVYSFSMYNEPDNINQFPVWEWVERMKICSDAIQSAVIDMNNTHNKSLTAQIYAPNTDGSGSTNYTNTWGQSAVTSRHNKFDGTTDNNWYNFRNYNYQKYSQYTNNDGSSLGYINDINTLSGLITSDIGSEQMFPLSLTEYNVRTSTNFDSNTGNSLNTPEDFCMLAANSIVLAVTGAKELYLFKFGTTLSDTGSNCAVVKTGTYYVSNSGGYNYGGASKGAEVYRLFCKALRNDAKILQHTHVNLVSSTLLAYNSSAGSYYLYAVNKTLSSLKLDVNLSKYNIPININNVYIEEVSSVYNGNVSTVTSITGSKLFDVYMPPQSVWLVNMPKATVVPIYNVTSTDTQLRDGIYKNTTGNVEPMYVRSDGTQNGRSVALLKFTGLRQIDFNNVHSVYLSLNATTSGYSFVSPPSLFGLSLWLDALSGVETQNGKTTLNSKITAWKDQSGNNRNFQQPSLVGSYVTGLPYKDTLTNSIYFSAATNYYDPNASVLALSNSSLNPKTPYTLFAVARGGSGVNTIISKSTDNVKRRKLQLGFNGDPVNVTSNESQINLEDSPYLTVNTGESANVNVKRLLTARYNSDTEGLLRSNGSFANSGIGNYSLSVTNNAPVFLGASPFTIGGPSYNAEASNQMYLHEIILYERGLSDYETFLVESYLTKKYGLGYTVTGLASSGNVIPASTSTGPAYAQAHVYGCTTDNWTAGSSTWSSVSSILKQNVLSGTKIENNTVNNQGTINLITGQLNSTIYVSSTAFSDKKYIDVTNYVKPAALDNQNTVSFLLSQDHRWDYDVDNKTYGDMQPYGIIVSSRSAPLSSNRPTLVINKYNTTRIISNTAVPPVVSTTDYFRYNVCDARNNTTGLLSASNLVAYVSSSNFTTASGVTIVSSSSGLRTTSYSSGSTSITLAMSRGEYHSFSVASLPSAPTIKINKTYGTWIVNSNTRGPGKLALLYSTDNFSTYGTIFNITIPSKNANVSLNPYLDNWFKTNSLDLNAGESVQFRLVPYAAVRFDGLFNIRVSPACPTYFGFSNETRAPGYNNNLFFTTSRDIELGQYDVADVVSTNDRILSARNVNSNVYLSPFYMGDGITVDNSGTGMRGRGFGTTHKSISAALENNEYFSFSTVPLIRNSLQITSISGMVINRSTSGPSSVALVYNETDYWTEWTPIFNIDSLPANTNISLDSYIDLGLSARQITLVPNVSGYFRLVPYNSTSTSGNFEIVNTNPIGSEIKMRGTLRPLSVGTINPADFAYTRFSLITTYSDIVYKSVLNANSNVSIQDFDVYTYPYWTGTNRPAVIQIHGGGFTTAVNKSTQAYTISACKNWASRGYVAFAPEYRRRTGSGYSTINNDTSGVQAMMEAVIDINDFLNYIRPLSAVYKFDPNYIFIGGGSAGGIIGANVTHHTGSVSAVPDSSYVKPGGPVNPQRVVTFNKQGIRGSFAWWGSPFYITLNPNLSTSKFPETYPYSGDYRWYGEDRYTFYQISSATDTKPPKAGPGTMPSPSIPTIILHGSGDETNPFLCATNYLRDLSASGTPARLYVWPDAGHSLTREDELPGVFTNTSNFFLRRLYSLNNL